jgi:hypothetical protein
VPLEIMGVGILSGEPIFFKPSFQLNSLNLSSSYLQTGSEWIARIFGPTFIR